MERHTGNGMHPLRTITDQWKFTSPTVYAAFKTLRAERCGTQIGRAFSDSIISMRADQVSSIVPKWPTYHNGSARAIVEAFISGWPKEFGPSELVTRSYDFGNHRGPMPAAAWIFGNMEWCYYASAFYPDNCRQITEGKYSPTIYIAPEVLTSLEPAWSDCRAWVGFRDPGRELPTAVAISIPTVPSMALESLDVDNAPAATTGQLPIPPTPRPTRHRTSQSIPQVIMPAAPLFPEAGLYPQGRPLTELVDIGPPFSEFRDRESQVISNGIVISLASEGNALIVNDHTLPFSAVQRPSWGAKLEHDIASFLGSASVSPVAKVVIASHTLTEGQTAVTIDGITVSVIAGGNKAFVNGHTVILRPSKEIQTREPLAVTENVIVVSIMSGENGVVVDGRTMSFHSISRIPSGSEATMPTGTMRAPTPMKGSADRNKYQKVVSLLVFIGHIIVQFWF
ncbi:hypothetical protein EJ08DRAFT_697231 [Tothia fuscella]|uniref:Uncharacterized protein n=1 Tax=Tothia fuscella TaxID=1048955 RepID=A0A9P4NSH2_9PEZI|nr:hypothetical protein EJ08DRAFT_697231 [Tothia fuscella]